MGVCVGGSTEKQICRYWFHDYGGTCTFKLVEYTIDLDVFDAWHTVKQFVQSGDTNCYHSIQKEIKPCKNECLPPKKMGMKLARKMEKEMVFFFLAGLLQPLLSTVSSQTMTDVGSPL